MIQNRVILEALARVYPERHRVRRQCGQYRTGLGVRYVLRWEDYLHSRYDTAVYVIGLLWDERVAVVEVGS